MRAVRGIGRGVGLVWAMGVRFLGVARYEYRLGLRTAFFWIMAGILLLLDLFLFANNNPTHLGIAWTLSREMLPITSLLIIFFVASASHRPVRERVTEIVLVRRVSSEELVLARFAGILALALTLVVIQLLGGVVVRYLMAGPNEPIPKEVTGWARVGQHLVHFFRDSDPLAIPYRQAFWDSFPSLLFFSALAYLLALLGRAALVGALAGLYWFAAAAGSRFLPRVTDWTLRQNGPPHLLVGLFLLLLAMLWYERRRRSRGARYARWLGRLGVLALLAAVLVALRTAIATQEWRLLATDYRTHYAQREAEAGARPPNYAWLDQHGRRVSLGGLRGQVILLAFWEPGDRELEATLKRLKEWWREFHREGLAVIGVGLSDDLDVASQVAQAQNVPFPMVVDLENVVIPDRDPEMDSESPSFDPDDPTMGPSPGGPRQRGEAVSPTATAFGVGHGSALLLDREGRLCEEKLSLDEKAAKQTRQTIEKYVRGEG